MFDYEDNGTKKYDQEKIAVDMKNRSNLFWNTFS